jgi:hypothetical protein
MVKNLILLLGFVLSLPVLAARIEVSSDRNPVGFNESFQLVYQSSDEVDGDPDFSVLEGQLDILNRSQSNNISIINGEYSRSQRWVLNVMARQAGTLKLPSVPFGDDLSAGLTIQVNPASQGAAQSETFHTRVRFSSDQPLVQQQLIVTQQMFSPYTLSNYALGDLQFSGIDVVVEALGEAKQYRTQINGTAFIVVEKRYAVFPQQSGELILQPALAEAQTAASGGTFFDPFNSRGKILRARSTQKSIRVQPLPNDANSSPWLPARSLQILEQWPQEPPRFTVGEPLTRTLSIKAEGLTAAQLPDLSAADQDDLKQYPDQPLLENISNDDGITGYRVEKVAYIPTRPGSITLPAIEIAWWNTATGQAETARVPARTVEVQPSPDAPVEPAQPVAPPQTAIQPLRQPAQHPVAPEMPATPTSTHESGESYWIWIAAITSLGWFTTVVSWWLFNQRQKSAPRPSETIQPRDSRQAFKQLQKACREGDTRLVRERMLAWGKLEFGENFTTGLSELASNLPTELAEQLRKLDASLYAASAAAVDIPRLLDALKHFDSDRRRRSPGRARDGLEPLYNPGNQALNLER